MKIAMITETFLPSTDGIVTRLYASIRWLMQEGHKVLIIAPDLGPTVPILKGVSRARIRSLQGLCTGTVGTGLRLF